MAKNTFINQAEISHYLKDVRKRKVLTPAREKELAKIMLTEGTPPEVIEQIHLELLEGNLRFVISVAKDYQNQGISLPDLIAEGNYGLLKAIKNFVEEDNKQYVIDTLNDINLSDKGGNNAK